MSAITKTRIDGLTERVLERARRFEADLMEGIEPYGVKNVPDALFGQWFAWKAGQYAPMAFRHAKTGQVLVVNPWIASLQYVKGGPEMVKRYLRQVGQEAA